nr:MAG TPA: hypothetical protein [Caudoviricetes sp.]
MFKLYNIFKETSNEINENGKVIDLYLHITNYQFPYHHYFIRKHL